MKIIIEKQSKVVLYAGTFIQLTDRGVVGDDFVDMTNTPDNAEITEVADLPPHFMGGRFTYADGIWTGDPAYLDDVASSTKLAMAAAIRAKYGAMLSQLAAPYGPEERETWLVQEAEAKEWQADNNASCPMIRLMAANRGIAMESLVQKILENAALFRAESGRLLGLQQKELDEIYKGGV